MKRQQREVGKRVCGEWGNSRHRPLRCISLVLGWIDTVCGGANGVLCADCEFIQAVPGGQLGPDCPGLLAGQSDGGVQGCGRRAKSSDRVSDSRGRRKPISGLLGSCSVWTSGHRGSYRAARRHISATFTLHPTRRCFLALWKKRSLTSRKVPWHARPSDRLW